MLHKILRNKIKYSILFSLLIYILLNIFVLIQREQSKRGLEKFDLDKNGFFENEEITTELDLELRKVSSDTGMSLAPITTIPISIFFGLLIFLLIKLISKRLDNKLIDFFINK